MTLVSVVTVERPSPGAMRKFMATFA